MTDQSITAIRAAVRDVLTPTRVQMDEYEFHPFADAFPMMTDREHAELVADIKANGLRDPIMRYQGKILDGRNRYLACGYAPCHQFLKPPPRRQCRPARRRLSA